MATDFRASQIRTNRIITSGSTGTPASLLIYDYDQDGTPPNQGNIDSSFDTSQVGADAFVYISGSEDKRTVFGGGLTLSGTMIALQGLPLGQYADETYQQGIFEDWTSTTTIGYAVREINNLLKGLAPSKPPFLSTANSSQSGPQGKLIVDDVYPISGYTTIPEKTIDQTFSSVVAATTTSLGVFAPGTTFAGYLASNVSTGPGSPYSSYAAKAFQKADAGTLALHFNGSVVREVDLSTAGVVNDGAATGFILSSTSSVVFAASGVEFSGFQYRTGTWKVAVADQRNGYNSVRITHTINGFVYETNEINWFVDAGVVAVGFVNEEITGLTFTGNKYLSGVKYYTGGSYQYRLTGSGVYSAAVYSTSQMTYTANANLQSLAADPIPASGGDHSKDINITKPIAFQTSGIRLVDGSVTATVTIPTVLNGSSTSLGVPVTGILIDSINASSTATNESFTSETYRLPSNSNFALTTLNSGLWDSSLSITAAGKSQVPGYNDGLLVGEGRLKTGTRNYNSITNGPTSNADYSTNMGSGDRSYYRVFSNSNLGCANFILNMQGSGVTFIDANAAFTAANQMKVEFTAPTQTGWLCAYGDFISGQFSDGNGGRAASFGLGRALNTNWGLTIGTKNIVSSGYRVYLKLTVPYNFTGYLTNIAWTFLE